MSRAKKKGTLMETRTVDYLQTVFEDGEKTIHRVALHGSKDEGDIHGLSFRGMKIIAEVKNCKSYAPREWLRQAERERGNADADISIVVFHINGIGLDTLESMGEQGVLIKLRDLCKLIGGKVVED